MKSINTFFLLILIFLTLQVSAQQKDDKKISYQSVEAKNPFP